MRAIVIVASMVSAVAVLSGCAAKDRFDNGALIREGVGTRQSPDEVKAYSDNQGAILNALLGEAGLEGALPGAGNEEWKAVTYAGINYIDQKCEMYIQALFRLNRTRRMITADLAAAGATTAAMMGLVDASAKSIALVAASLGFATVAIDSGYASVLYELEPASVRTVIEESQQAVRREIDKDETKIKNRYQAVAALQNYVAACLPASIEANINKTLQKAKYTIDPLAAAAETVDPEKLNKLKTNIGALKAAADELRRSGDPVRKKTGDDAMKAIEAIESDLKGDGKAPAEAGLLPKTLRAR